MLRVLVSKDLFHSHLSLVLLVYGEAKQQGGLHGVERSCSPQQGEREWWRENPSGAHSLKGLPSFKVPHSNFLFPSPSNPSTVNQQCIDPSMRSGYLRSSLHKALPLNTATLGSKPSTCERDFEGISDPNHTTSS